MNARGVCVVLALCLCVLSQPALQAADGWFGNSATSAGGSSSSKKSSKSSWFSWPSSNPKVATRSKPSMVDSVTRSTKSTWNKTVSFLNPFDNKPAAKAATPKSQPNTGSWFQSADPVKKPTSVPEWLGGEMPSY